MTLILFHISRDTPPTSWLYPDLSPDSPLLTNASWLAVLSEARSQLITLHEGGNGIWAGCLGHLGVLLQCLLQEKAEADNVSVSEVREAEFHVALVLELMVCDILRSEIFKYSRFRDFISDCFDLEFVIIFETT